MVFQQGSGTIVLEERPYLPLWQRICNVVLIDSQELAKLSSWTGSYPCNSCSLHNKDNCPQGLQRLFLEVAIRSRQAARHWIGPTAIG